MIGYYQVTVVVDGAVEAEEEFEFWHDVKAFVDEQEQEQDLLTEIYILYHPHKPSKECLCAQYEQNYKPEYTFHAEKRNSPYTSVRNVDELPEADFYGE